MWHTEIIEGFTGGNAKADGASCVELSDALNRLHAASWQVRFMLPNGVNRWTVVCFRPREGAQ